MDAGLSAGDLITHVNGTSVQGLLHIELVRLILTGGASVALRTVPLASTSIRIGARKVPNTVGGLGMVFGSEMCGPEQMPYTPRHRRRRKYDRHGSSLFRQLSNRKAAEQQMSATSSPLSPHQRSMSSSDSVPGSPTTVVPRLQSTAGAEQWTSDSAHSSSQSSSPGSSAPGSPAVAGSPPVPITVGGRPSSLHGLKHKLAVSRPAAGSRRKSWHNNPLSPLVRTPSPSTAAATSPSRSPSPLTTASGIHHRHITGGAPLVAAHVPGISNMAQLYNPAQPHTGIGLTAVVASNQPHKPAAVLAAADVGLLRRTLSPERRLSGHHHGHAEVHRRSMTGQLERGIGLLGVEPDTSLRPDKQSRAGRDSRSSGTAVTSLTFPDNVAAAGQGDVGSYADRRRDARFCGRGRASEPLRVDIDSPSRAPSFVAGSSQSRQSLSESSQVRPVRVDVRTTSRQDSRDATSSDFDVFDHSQLAGGDCVRSQSEPHSSEDPSKALLVGVRSSIQRTETKPGTVASVPVAIKTATKDGKETKDSTTG